MCLRICTWEICDLLLFNHDPVLGTVRPPPHCPELQNKRHTTEEKPQRAWSSSVVAFIVKRRTAGLQTDWGHIRSGDTDLSWMTIQTKYGSCCCCCCFICPLVTVNYPSRPPSFHHQALPPCEQNNLIISAWLFHSCQSCTFVQLLSLMCSETTSALRVVFVSTLLRKCQNMQHISWTQAKWNRVYFNRTWHQDFFFLIQFKKPISFHCVAMEPAFFQQAWR